MNVQRLIEKYKELWNEHSPFYEPVPYTSMVELFLKELKQLDESEKATIPQFVADYIEFKKKNDFHVYGAMRVIEDHYDKRVPEWFYEGNIEKFCLAWIFGYEVEEEKRYTVVMKAIKQPLYYNAGDKKLFFSLGGLATKFTRKQLEDAGFGWVFDCPGVEVEEVE